MRFVGSLFSKQHYALRSKDSFCHHMLMIPDSMVVPSASTRHLIVLEVAAAAAVAAATEAAATDVEAVAVATTAAAAAVSLRSMLLTTVTLG